MNFVCHSNTSRATLEDEVNRLRKGRFSKAYVGSETGISIIHPATNVDCSASYDPRVRPWYVGVHGRTSNLIYVKVQEPEHVERAKEIAKYLVNNAGRGSFVQIVDGNNEDITVENLCSEAEALSDLVQEKMFRSVEGIIWKEQVFNSTAIMNCGNEFFGAIDQKYKNMLYYIGDQIPDADIFITEKQKRPNLQNVAVNMVIIGDVSEAGKKDLEEITCSTNGIYVHDDGSRQSIASLMAGLSRYLQHSVSIERPVWSPIYEDAFGFGQTITLSMPVMTSSRMMGVAAIDVPVSHLMDTYDLTKEEI